MGVFGGGGGTELFRSSRKFIRFYCNGNSELADMNEFVELGEFGGGW